MKKVNYFFILSICALLGLSSYGCARDKYTGPPSTVAIDLMLDKYATDYGKAHNMELIQIGKFKESSHQMRFGIWLRAYSPVTLQAGRDLAAALVSNLWQTLKESPKAHTYFEDTKQSIPKEYRNEMCVQNVGVKIAYWDKDVNRPLPPHLAEISFYDGKFHYYQADPKTQALNLILEETYAEAVAKSEPKPVEKP